MMRACIEQLGHVGCTVVLEDAAGVARLPSKRLLLLLWHYKEDKIPAIRSFTKHIYSLGGNS